jgi:hypothetical protein
MLPMNPDNPTSKTAADFSRSPGLPPQLSPWLVRLRSTRRDRRDWKNEDRDRLFGQNRRDSRRALGESGARSHVLVALFCLGQVKIAEFH